ACMCDFKYQSVSRVLYHVRWAEARASMQSWPGYAPERRVVSCPEPLERHADTLAAHGDAVHLLEMPHQDRIGPAGGLIAHAARVLVEDCSDQRVDDSMHGPGPSRARRVPEPRPKTQPGAAPELLHPVVHRLAADLQVGRDPRHRSPLREPE